MACWNETMKTTAGRQRGDALLEALIGIVLMAVVGLGLAYSTARAANSQRYLNTQNLAIAEIREKLQHVSEPCATDTVTITLAGKSVDFSPECTTENVTVRYTVNGTETSETLASVKTLTSVSTAGSDVTRELFGGDGSIVISLQ